MGAAKCAARAAENGPVDADLARLIDAWPTLGDETKRAVLALVETDFMTGETIRVDGGRHLR